MSGICEMSLSSARVSDVVAMVSVAGFVWSPGGIRGRKGEVLSSRDLRGGEEVGAFDAIDSKLPLASHRSAAFRNQSPEMFSGVSRSNLVSRVSRTHAMSSVSSYYSTVASKTRPKTVFSGIQPTGIPHVSHLDFRVNLHYSQSYS